MFAAEMPSLAPLPGWLENSTQMLILVTLTNSFFHTEMILSHIPRMVYTNTFSLNEYNKPIFIEKYDVVFLVVFCEPFDLFRYLNQTRNVKFSWNHSNPFLIVPDCNLQYEPVVILKNLWIQYGLINSWIHLNSQWLTINLYEDENLKIPKPFAGLRNLKGWPLRISLFKRNRSVYRKANGEWAGDEIWILNQCLKCMNATARYVPTISADKYGESLELVYGSKSDILFNAIFVKAYKSGLEFSVTVGDDALCLVVPKASPLTQAWALERSLPSFAKISVVLSCLVIIMNEYIENIIRHIKPDISLIILENIRTFLSFPTPQRPKCFVSRLRLICLLYLGYLFSMALQIKLLPSLTRPQYGPQIESVDDLIKSDITIRIGASNLYDTFLGNDSWGKLKNRIILQITEPKKIHKGLLIRLDDLEMETLNINYHLMTQCPSTYRLAYVYKIGEAWNQLFNRCLDRLVESGLINFIKRTDIKILKERALREILLQPRPLVLEDLQMAFILYFFGIAFSFFIYLITFMNYWCKLKKQVK